MFHIALEQDRLVLSSAFENGHNAKRMLGPLDILCR